MATPGRLRRLLLQEAKARADAALTLRSNGEQQELFAPFSPSPVTLIDAVWAKIEQLKILSEADLLVDLGCGDGRWLVSGVKRFNCKALGVELDEQLVRRASQAVREQGLQGRVQVQHGDVMQTDVSAAKLVIVYAFAESLGGIADRLKQQLGHESCVLSVGFRVPGWKPRCSEREGGLRWYLYQMSECT